MTLFFYKISKPHTSADTDKYILKSLDYLGIKNKKVLRTEKGKPFIDRDVFVGVSHTNGTLIIGVENFEFGIDCEHGQRNPKQINSVAEKYYTDEEKFSGENFIDIWVKKEAYIKFLGTGLADLSKADTVKLKNNFTRVEHDGLIIYIYSENEIKNIKKITTN